MVVLIIHLTSALLCDWRGFYDENKPENLFWCLPKWILDFIAWNSGIRLNGIVFVKPRNSWLVKSVFEAMIWDFKAIFCFAKLLWFLIQCTRQYFWNSSCHNIKVHYVGLLKDSVNFRMFSSHEINCLFYSSPMSCERPNKHSLRFSQKSYTCENEFPNVFISTFSACFGALSVWGARKRFFVPRDVQKFMTQNWISRKRLSFVVLCSSGSQRQSTR